jgi:stress response protein YsnF
MGTGDDDPDYDAAGFTTNDPITHSPRRLSVDAGAREAVLARLSEHVGSAHPDVSGPVSHEDVNLDPEPTIQANPGMVYDGPTISKEKPEDVLREKRPAAGTGAVPEEHVRLGTKTHSEHETLGEEVRYEQTEVDADSLNVPGR